MKQQRSTCLMRLLIALAAGFATCAAFAQPVFEGLGDLPGGIRGSLATGVSADGSVVVGIANFTFQPNIAGNEAFRWTRGTGMVSVGVLPSRSSGSQANAVSADGSVIVGRSFSASEFEAFRWTQNAGMTGLGDITGGPFNSSALAASGDGSVVVGLGTRREGATEPFRWSATTGMVGLGHFRGGAFAAATDVSYDGMTVIGFDIGPNGGEAFRWTKKSGHVGLGHLFGGGRLSSAHAVTPDGSSAVGSRDSFQGNQAFLWTETAGMIGLGDLPGGAYFSSAEDISADGNTVVGRSSTGMGGFGEEAFIWDPDRGVRNLRELLINDFGADLSQWLLVDAFGISDDGRTIVGWGFHNGFDEAWMARIPEPTTIWLFAVGLLPIWRWRIPTPRT